MPSGHGEKGHPFFGLKGTLPKKRKKGHHWATGILSTYVGMPYEFPKAHHKFVGVPTTPVRVDRCSRDFGLPFIVADRER